jgi:lipopolysaccharide export system permease protein
MEAFVLSILHRMILWELVKIFFLSLLALTGILLLAGIVAEASKQGLGPAQILAIIPLLIPSTLPYTIPATTLFSACIVYGRLSADNEILAIKSAGVNLIKVVWPGVILGVLMSVATMALYFQVIPYTHYLMRTIFMKDANELIYGVLKKEHCLNSGTGRHAKYYVQVKQVQGKKLIDATFKEFDDQGRQRWAARAQEAELEVDLATRQLKVTMHYGNITHEDGTTFDFNKKVFEEALPEGFGSLKPPRPTDMNWHQLKQSRAELEANITKLDDEVRHAGDAPEESPHKGRLQDHLKDLADRRHVYVSEIRQIDSEFQMRPALAFGCVCFVLVGCPVGIWFSRSDYLSAFITCFLPVVFVYYPLMLCGTNLAKEGKFPPSLAVWSADAVVAIVGVGLLWRMLRN